MKKKTNPPVKHSPKKSSLGLRAVAAQIIREVHFKQRSLSVVLPEFLTHVESNQQALLQQISYGTLRWFFKLDVLLKKLLKKPPRAKDNIIYYLLIVGLYQLLYLDKPDYAVVKETVSELGCLDRTWAKGLINAILRRVIREKETLLKSLEQPLQVKTAHPIWLLKRLQNDWEKAEIEQILSANNQQPPFWLRFNQSKVTEKQYLALLEQQQLEFQVLSADYPAIQLEKPIAVEKIPGFDQGQVSVQDGAAQCAAILLDVQKGDTVLDACAAPGGKTSHLLEKYPDMQSLLALDISQTRLEQIKSNFQRLDLDARLLQGDAIVVDSWWDGKHFDRILLDAPCSATGVIRRHPDIKLLRQDSDIKQLIQTQQAILESMWSILKPGGLLLYATCSILRDENDRQITAFLSKHKDAEEKPIALPWGRAMQHGWQIFPGEAQLDGFYYASIIKMV
ncbi:MAG: 16S rRNA (cytosine(967)-C(5))-methyltransferase RsmB [Pseudomonadota bacterium]